MGVPEADERGNVVSPQLSKWEYLEVFVDKTEWRDSTGKKGTLPPPAVGGGPAALGTRGAPASGLAERLAKDGWELSSIIPGAAAGVYRLVFKRTRG